MVEKTYNPQGSSYDTILRTRALAFSIFSEFNSWLGFREEWGAIYTRNNPPSWAEEGSKLAHPETLWAWSSAQSNSHKSCCWAPNDVPSDALESRLQDASSDVRYS